MLFRLVGALVLSVAWQPPASDRDLAEQMARAGRTAEALAAFEKIVAESPKDVEVQLWIARLHLRSGRSEEAEAEFRNVLLEHPLDVDARIGLGVALTRRGAWEEALTILHAAESDAGNNGDLFAALARAYRRSGDDLRAIEYYQRAMELAPGDKEVVDAYEAMIRANGSSLTLEGFAEGGVSDANSLSLIGSFRVRRRLEVEGRARVQTRADSSDTLLGGGVILRLSRSTNLVLRGAGGTENTSLANADLMTELRHYHSGFEIGGIVRHMAFQDADVTALTPLLAWDRGGRWRFAARYTYSKSSFHTTGESVGDNSGLLRATLRPIRRVSAVLTYAYGIESFEDLTADRVGNLGSHTLAATVQVHLPSLTTVATTWERQLRENDTKLDRLTVVIVQGFK